MSSKAVHRFVRRQGSVSCLVTCHSRSSSASSLPGNRRPTVDLSGHAHLDGFQTTRSRNGLHPGRPHPPPGHCMSFSQLAPHPAPPRVSEGPRERQRVILGSGRVPFKDEPPRPSNRRAAPSIDLSTAQGTRPLGDPRSAQRGSVGRCRRMPDRAQSSAASMQGRSRRRAGTSVDRVMQIRLLRGVFSS